MLRDESSLGILAENRPVDDRVHRVPGLTTTDNEYIRIGFVPDRSTEAALLERDVRPAIDGRRVWQVEVEANTTDREIELHGAELLPVV